MADVPDLVKTAKSQRNSALTAHTYHGELLPVGLSECLRPPDLARVTLSLEGFVAL